MDSEKIRLYQKIVIEHILDKIALHVKKWKFYDEDIDALLELEERMQTRIPEAPGEDPYFLYGESCI